MRSTAIRPSSCAPAPSPADMRNRSTALFATRYLEAMAAIDTGRQSVPMSLKARSGVRRARTSCGNWLAAANVEIVTRTLEAGSGSRRGMQVMTFDQRRQDVIHSERRQKGRSRRTRIRRSAPAPPMPRGAGHRSEQTATSLRRRHIGRHPVVDRTELALETVRRSRPIDAVRRSSSSPTATMTTPHLASAFGGIVRVVREPALGQQAARSKGIRVAASSWVARTRDDDIYCRNSSNRFAGDDEGRADIIEPTIASFARIGSTARPISRPRRGAIGRASGRGPGRCGEFSGKFPRTVLNEFQSTRRRP